MKKLIIPAVIILVIWFWMSSDSTSLLEQERTLDRIAEDIHAYLTMSEPLWTYDDHADRDRILKDLEKQRKRIKKELHTLRKSNIPEIQEFIEQATYVIDELYLRIKNFEPLDYDFYEETNLIPYRYQDAKVALQFYSE